jgi:SSS family solute:Na+ symporter
MEAASQAMAGTPLDYVIIIVYFIGILAFGTFFARHTKTTKDFFFSGQRFSWWLIAFSCVATVVGSYSFIKYSSRGFVYGLSSTMTYTNDWFLVPLFMLGWLPLIYFARIASIPEYFEKRFDRPTRIMAVTFILIYMVGYVGINLYTMGIAINAVMRGAGVSIIQSMTPDSIFISLGGPVFFYALIVAVVCCIYVTFGGQTAVVMTDLLQSCILLVAGFVLLFLGMSYLGGWGEFWRGLDIAHKMPFSDFNSDPKFPMVGIFWQDFFGSSLALYFMNQGMIMRFLAVKSVREGRKAIIFVILVLMPLAAIAVSGAGWVGRSMATAGIIDPATPAKDIFVVVAEIVTRPGVFGLILAALTAALMSTTDTLVNASAAIAVNDIWKPFIVRGRPDRYYLKVGRIFSVIFYFAGILLVPLYASFKSIYEAHAAFTAAITPPLIVAIILGITWKRFTPKAAFITLLGGVIVMSFSIAWPGIIGVLHLDQGVALEGYKYMRALYGLVVSFIIALVASFFTKPKPEESLQGLWIGSLQKAKELFKGGSPNDRDMGKKILLTLEELKEETEKNTEGAIIDPKDLEKMKARTGDLIYVADKRRWLGGLRSVHARALEGKAKKGSVLLSHQMILEGRLRLGEQVRIEKII